MVLDAWFIPRVSIDIMPLRQSYRMPNQGRFDNIFLLCHSVSLTTDYAYPIIKTDYYLDLFFFFSFVHWNFDSCNFKLGNTPMEVSIQFNHLSFCQFDLKYSDGINPIYSIAVIWVPLDRHFFEVKWHYMVFDVLATLGLFYPLYFHYCHWIMFCKQ